MLSRCWRNRPRQAKGMLRKCNFHFCHRHHSPGCSVAHSHMPCSRRNHKRWYEMWDDSVISLMRFWNFNDLRVACAPWRKGKSEDAFEDCEKQQAPLKSSSKWFSSDCEKNKIIILMYARNVSLSHVSTAISRRTFHSLIIHSPYRASFFVRYGNFSSFPLRVPIEFALIHDAYWITPDALSFSLSTELRIDYAPLWFHHLSSDAFGAKIFGFVFTYHSIFTFFEAFQ